MAEYRGFLFITSYCEYICIIYLPLSIDKQANPLLHEKNFITLDMIYIAVYIEASEINQN